MPSSGYNAALGSALIQLLGQGQALGALKPAYETARGDLTARDYYDPYSKAGEGSLAMLGNALGLNGAEGNAAATQAFQSSPGYQFALNQGLQGVQRSAAAKGMLNSGNTMMALNDYAQGVANQDYGNWLSRVGGLTQLGLSAAGGETGRQNTLSGLDYGYGQNQANIYTNTANNIAKTMYEGQMSDAAAGEQRRANLFGGITSGLGLLGKIGGSFL